MDIIQKLEYCVGKHCCSQVDGDADGQRVESQERIWDWQSSKSELVGHLEELCNWDGDLQMPLYDAQYSTQQEYQRDAAMATIAPPRRAWPLEYFLSNKKKSRIRAVPGTA